MYLMGSRSPCEEVLFRGKDVLGHARRCFTVSYAKTVKQIQMPFGLFGLGWAQGTMCYTRSRSPYAKEQFLGERTCLSIRDDSIL